MKYRPESLMMSHGYSPENSQGAVKAPMFQTSTFVFNSAEEGKAYFELAYGLREKREDEEMGMIYSRLNNPNLQILEKRLSLWDQADDCAVFESGMAAISTAFMSILNPGDVLLYSNPVYGGTHHFIEQILTKWGIEVVPFSAEDTKQSIIEKVYHASGKLKMIYLETPANPTNALIDIEMCAEISALFSSEDRKVITTVDNTYMGPVWSHPLAFGADLVLYSATKYIGGHSDVIAGACLGSSEIMAQIKAMRTFLGNMASPHTAWLLMRSLETLQVRMEAQARNAKIVAEYLKTHTQVAHVDYLGFIDKNSDQYKIYQKQYTSAGAMISFVIEGGEKEAFQFLNSLDLIKLAVSLGSTESLAQHPASMTHIDVPKETREQMGITDSLIRLSVGLEHPKDLILDLERAFQVLASKERITDSQHINAQKPQQAYQTNIINGGNDRLSEGFALLPQ